MRPRRAYTSRVSLPLSRANVGPDLLQAVIRALPVATEFPLATAYRLPGSPVAGLAKTAHLVRPDRHHQCDQYGAYAAAKVAHLEEVFLVKRIPAWSRNVSSRAIGTPKLAFVDSGIAANLLGADVRSLLRPGGPFGPLLEGFVLMELARQLTWSRERAELFHYRTKDKVEVDAVLENRQGHVVGIEVKASSTVTAADFRGLRHLAERTGGDFAAGIVFYTGVQTLPFGPRLRAVPVSALWEI